MALTLADIQQKVRNITGNPSTDQLSVADLNNYINNYYQLTMPFELKEQVTLQTFSFFTIGNQDAYSFPADNQPNFLTDQPMAYADGFPLIFYQDPDIFYQDWPQQFAVEQVMSSPGGIFPINYTVQFPPILIGSPVPITPIPGAPPPYPIPPGPSSLTLADGFQTIVALSDGSFIDSATRNPVAGSVNFTTGVITGAQFANASTAGNIITAKYQGMSATRPQGILFFQNQFFLRPVPDISYTISMQGYVQPKALDGSANLNTAIFPEWGWLLAYGAACDIFSERGDFEKYQEYYTILKRYENVALARMIQQYDASQSVPRF